MKQTIMRAVILGIVSLGTGLLYNYFHQPHLPVFAHNAEEIKSADSLALSGRLEQVNQPLTIVLDQAQNLYARGEALFIDARAEADFLRERIPGAINIPIEELSDPVPIINTLKAASYVTYCDGDPCMLSTDLAYLMVELGLQSVFVFHEGLDIWRQAEQPLARGEE